MNAIFRMFLPVAAVALLAGSVPAQAQQQAPPQEEAPAAPITDAQLEKFSGAYKKVQEIQVEAESRLESVEDPEEARQLQEQANEQMLKAVKDNGLEAPEFNQIARALTSDPDVQKRFEKIQKEGK